VAQQIAMLWIIDNTSFEAHTTYPIHSIHNTVGEALIRNHPRRAVPIK